LKGGKDFATKEKNKDKDHEKEVYEAIGEVLNEGKKNGKKSEASGGTVEKKIRRSVIHKVTKLQKSFTMIVGLDTQANCSLIKDLPLVDSLESNLDLIPINGIENAGGFVAGQLGNFTEFNVEAFFDTRAPCNILSFSEVAQKHRIEFSSENNCFTIWRYPYNMILTI